VLPTTFFTTTCDIYRPFGAGSPTTTGVPCRLTPVLIQGNRGVGGLSWTHYLDLPADADVRDGCTRNEASPDVVYADGDELRVPGGSSTTRYAVVWVETHNRGGPNPFRRAYLARHEASWPDV